MAPTTAWERDMDDEEAVRWIKTRELICGEGAWSEYQNVYYLPKVVLMKAVLWSTEYGVKLFGGQFGWE